MAAALVGREQELVRIDAFLAQGRSGPAALAIAGEAGIGKTVLWTRAVAQAGSNGADVLACRAVEAEASLAFTGLADLLAESTDAIRTGLSGPRRRALDVALLVEEPGAVAPDTRALGMAFLDVLRIHAAARPVLVAIDDVQWLDASTAGVLGFALRRLRDEPVALLTTVRSGSESAVPVEPDTVEWLPLEPFSLAALHHLLRERLGLELTRSELSRLQAATGGNPYFALEVGRELARLDKRPAAGAPLPVPATLHELLGRRLARLDRRARRVLLSAAVLARPTVEILTRAHKSSATQAIEQATRAGLIERDEDRVRFSHPLLATVCYREAPAAERRTAHRALAAVVTDIEERARHLALGAEAPGDELAATLGDAAEFASARGGTASAADLWELAADLTPAADAAGRRRRLFLAAEAHRLAGDRARAAAMLDALLPEAAPGAERADALFALATTRRASLPAMAALCEAALAELEDDDARAAAISIFLSWIRVSEGDVRAALAVAREALAHAERSGDDTLVARAIGRTAMAETWTAQITPGLLERGVELERGLGRLLEFHESPAVAFERRLICQGELDLARSLLTDVEASAAEHGDEGTRGHALVHLVLLEWYAGNWHTALTHADAALALAEQMADDELLALVLDVRAIVELYLGRVDQAQAALERSTRLADAASDTLIPLWNQAVFGALELARGDVAAAGKLLADLPARFTELGWMDPADHIWPDTIETLGALGDLGRARAYLDQFEELGGRLASRWVVANAWRCRGLLAAAEGDLEGAFAAFEQALTEHESLHAPFERARTLLALGSTRRRAKLKRTAREALEQALALFEELGARLWAERTRNELARIGGRAAGQELTASERRVAELAAEGRSNREIAAALFVTAHTVETHLSSAYRKLGIRSRAALSSALALHR